MNESQSIMLTGKEVLSLIRLLSQKGRFQFHCGEELNGDKTGERKVRWEPVEIIQARTWGSLEQPGGPGDREPGEDPTDVYVVD